MQKLIHWKVFFGCYLLSNETAPTFLSFEPVCDAPSDPGLYGKWYGEGH